MIGIVIAILAIGAGLYFVVDLFRTPINPPAPEPPRRQRQDPTDPDQPRHRARR